MMFLLELREFLSSNGRIYTVRRFDVVKKEVEVLGVGTCLRTPMGAVPFAISIDTYTSQSGFPTFKAWMRAIRRMIPPGKPWYLYKVEVLGHKGGIPIEAEVISAETCAASE